MKPLGLADAFRPNTAACRRERIRSGSCVVGHTPDSGNGLHNSIHRIGGYSHCPAPADRRESHRDFSRERSSRVAGRFIARNARIVHPPPHYNRVIEANRRMSLGTAACRHSRIDAGSRLRESFTVYNPVAATPSNLRLPVAATHETDVFVIP